MIGDQMRSGPRLSIGLPVFNGERYLGETLDCLLGQTFRDFELVVCDNASTDRTPEIVAAAMAKDPRVRYVRNDTNIGASPNFAKVASLTTAPLFKWAAHDDLYDAAYLETCINVLDAAPEVVMAHSDCTFIDGEGRAFPPGRAHDVYVHPDTGLEIAVDPVALGEQSSPLARFTDVIFNSRLGTHMFGVIRRSALDRTASIQNIPSSDRPLLAELALLGPFRQVRARLFHKRFHSGMSWALSGEEVKAYVSGTTARYSPNSRKMRIYLATPSGKPVSFATKAACCGVVLAYSAKVAYRNLLKRRAVGGKGGAAVPPAHADRRTPPDTRVQVL
jgi:glycosyltransferase involved in cell wall biosynthesis